MSAQWTFGGFDVTGNPITDVLSDGIDVVMQQQRLGHDQIAMTLPMESEAAAAILSTTSDVYLQGYRQPAGGGVDTRSIRFNGPLWQREVQDDSLMLLFRSPRAYLSKRYATPAAVFAATDLGSIIKQLVDTSNSVDGDTGIDTNVAWITTSSSVTIDLSEQLPSIDEFLGSVADQLDGCESWLVPQELAGGKIAQLWCAPRRGSDRSQTVVFAWGEGTDSNCESMGWVESKDDVVNDARGFANDLSSVKVDATSIASIRRLVEYISLTNETSQAQMDARTQGVIDQRSSLSLVAKYALTPAQNAPVLFDDYEAGDIVGLHYVNGAYERIVAQRVQSSSVAIIDGYEYPLSVEVGS